MHTWWRNHQLQPKYHENWQRNRSFDKNNPGELWGSQAEGMNWFYLGYLKETCGLVGRGRGLHLSWLGKED